MSEERVWSWYWNCDGQHGNPGGQKCPCGGTVDCKDRDKHITEYVKKHILGSK